MNPSRWISVSQVLQVPLEACHRKFLKAVAQIESLKNCHLVFFKGADVACSTS